MVRAKFKVTSKSPPYGEGDRKSVDIGMDVVTSGSAENDSFFRWTPSGQLKLSTVNEAAAAQLELGEEYYLDITPARAAAETTALPSTPAQGDNEEGGAGA